MSTPQSIEICASSEKSFEDAIEHGLDRASRCAGKVSSACLKGQKVVLENGVIKEFRVDMQVTFIPKA